jgi:DNA-binding transcriptional regulator LsrR (DeoR family)
LLSCKLLAADLDAAEAVRLLARRYRLSERQAWRYVEQARDQGILEVPKPKVVFTVKLPTDLVRHVRRQAKQREQTISALVAQALKEFLERLGARSRDGR